MSHSSRADSWGAVVAPTFIHPNLWASGSAHGPPSEAWPCGGGTSSARTGPGSTGPYRPLQREGEPRGPTTLEGKPLPSGRRGDGLELATGGHAQLFLVGKEPSPLLISPEKLYGVAGAGSPRASALGGLTGTPGARFKSERKWQQRPFSRRRKAHIPHRVRRPALETYFIR